MCNISLQNEVQQLLWLREAVIMEFLKNPQVSTPVPDWNVCLLQAGVIHIPLYIV